MAETGTRVVDRPAWVDMGSSDAAASRDFYAKVLGWSVQVNPDPQYGGYALAKLDGRDVAGIGPAMSADQPTVWSLYIGTADADVLAAKVRAAGGSVVMEPFAVGDQGRMAIFQDPSGAFIGAWEASTMGGFATRAPGSFAWAELNARGIDRAIAFYTAVFGWTSRTSDMPDGTKYTEFQVDGQSIAGGMEMSAMIPPEVPSYWLVYFGVDNVDASFRRALEAGAREMLAPMDFPGGRFAILADPQGASFGLLKMTPA